MANGIGHLPHHILLIAFGALLSLALVEANAGEALFAIGMSAVLLHILVDVCQFEVRLLVLSVEHRSGSGEECVVEVNHLRQASPVVAQCGLLWCQMLQIMLCSVQNLPVTSAPAVYALLDIAHEQTVTACGYVLEEQAAEVAPL